jgi:hypothetical protein
MTRVDSQKLKVKVEGVHAETSCRQKGKVVCSIKMIVLEQFNFHQISACAGMVEWARHFQLSIFN